MADNGSSNRDGKRKWDNGGDRRRGRGGGSMQHGSRPNKKRNMGRKEHANDQLDRRGRNAEQQARNKEAQEKGENEKPALPAAFSAEEVAAEERRPKRKVAVMVGYSGTGYKGMQIDNKQKTIEGDLFKAFVAAGAISKANADDPKKSALVRCARTDKGVHAAGNVISLKLIIEDEDIVDKINANLSEQIRIWGIQRTTGSFSCYQACDSRWYEYLIPTHSFLPPHPSSYMGKKLVEEAEKAGDLDEYNKRQAEVADFWSEVEEKSIKPILETLDDSIRPLVEEALYIADSTDTPENQDPVIEASIDEALKDETDAKAAKDASAKATSEEAAVETAQPDVGESLQVDETRDAVEKIEAQHPTTTFDDQTDGTIPLPAGIVNKSALEEAVKALKKAIMDAKRAYRISPSRQARVQTALNNYLGTRRYHNYTIQKKFTDSSAKRYIKSFKMDPKPILINDTEWLSLKVHGQSFMMHQIRKMVSMAALTVRCGTNPDIMLQSFENNVVRIPKAPGLGLLLERPVFDSYNDKMAKAHGREKIDFSRFEDKIQEFKEREIYQRIFREEAMGNQFNTFFTHLDNYKDTTFLYLTSGGIAATREGGKKKSTQPRFEEDSDGEGYASDN